MNKGILISVHMPKAGGTSFNQILRDHFGKNLKGDYKDFPLNNSLIERKNMAEIFHKKFLLYNRFFYSLNKIKCIHGHFMPYKYHSLLRNKNNMFVTWLRDPLERLGSHYYYWMRSYDPNKSPTLHKKVVEEKWSFEAFCFSSELQNVYKQFFWKFPIENFNFIGIAEHFDEDCNYFTENFLGTKMNAIPKKNINPLQLNSYFEDHNFRDKLKLFHAEDFKIYNYALLKRNLRLENLTL